MVEIYKHQVERFYTNLYMDHTTLDSEVEEDDLNYYNRHGKFTLRNCYTSENQFVENYGNPLSGVAKKYTTLVIERSDDKLSLKLFTGLKQRKVGKTWFKISKNVDYLTINTKTGDVYFGYLKNYQNRKKNQKSIKRNMFALKPFSSFELKVRNAFKNVDSLLDTEMINRSWVEILSKNIGFKNNKGTIDLFLLKSYLDAKRIKYPNNFEVFYSNYDLKVPLKLIRKFDMKLVDAFMSHHKLKGQKLKKVFHTCNMINLKTLKTSINLFGLSVVTQNLDFLNKVIHNKEDIIFILDFPLDSIMSDKEIKNVFYIYDNLVLENKVNQWTFLDHLKAYLKLKFHGERDLRWKSCDEGAFRKEHLDWYDKLEYYERGEYFRVYPKKLLDYVNKKMTINEVEYEARLLTSSKDYNHESNIQSNCVKTYIGRASSLIISLTKIENNSDERATVEYELKKDINKDVVVFNRKQYLGKYNSRLSEEWDDVLFKLDKTLLNYFSEKEVETVKLKKICQNGKEYYSDSIWDNSGSLKWNYSKII